MSSTLRVVLYGCNNDKCSSESFQTSKLIQHALLVPFISNIDWSKSSSASSSLIPLHLSLSTLNSRLSLLHLNKRCLIASLSWWKGHLIPLVESMCDTCLMVTMVPWTILPTLWISCAFLYRGLCSCHCPRMNSSDLARFTLAENEFSYIAIYLLRPRLH